MSAPVIPDRTVEEALADLIESIALEETALAHLVNAEAEKVQAIVGTADATAEDLIAVNQEVNRVMQTAVKMQILLQFKLENVQNMLADLAEKDDDDDPGHGGGGGGL